MTAKIPQGLLIGAGLLAGLLAIKAKAEKPRTAYLIGGAVVVGAGVAWNAYLENRVIQEVVAAGQFYAAPPAEIAQKVGVNVRGTEDEEPEE